MSALENQNLENEDLENVPLVRMEDVQPSRSRIDLKEDVGDPSEDEEVYETCIIDGVDYENDGLIDDDSDSNIGSMVSVQSVEMPDHDVDCDNAELIVPDIINPPVKEIKLEAKGDKGVKPNTPDSWPTLEILPGGIIIKPKKCETELNSSKHEEVCPKATGEMMYACAKCSQSFKYLFCLVKHVKWHEDQKKIMLHPNFKTLTSLEKQMIYIKREQNELEKTYKRQKLKVMARVASAIEKITTRKGVNILK